MDERRDAEPVPLAIVGAPAPFKEALIAVAVPAEFKVVTPDDVVAWAREDGTKVVVAVISNTCSWSDVERFASEPGLITVVVTPDLAIDGFIKALVLGSDGVVHADTSAHIIMSVVSAAVHGEVVLPAEAARMVAKYADREPSGSTPLNSEELHLITMLSQGMSMVQLSSELSWSERTLRRRLHNVCLKLGVANRAQAISKAVQLRLVE